MLRAGAGAASQRDLQRARAGTGSGTPLLRETLFAAMREG